MDSKTVFGSLGMVRICSFVMAMAACAFAAPNAPSDPGEIKTLVTQLGDPDFRVRQQAEQRLDQIGKVALPAVQEAARSSDPEVSARASLLARRLERHPIPGISEDATGAIYGANIEIAVDATSKVITLEEGTRKLRLVEDSLGVHVEVTATVDEKELTEKYDAPSAMQLRLENPEAAEIWDRWSGGEGLRFNLGAVKVNPGQHHKIARLLRRHSDRNLVAIRQTLNEAMEQKAVPAEKRKQVNSLIDQMALFLIPENAQPGAPDVPEGGVVAVSETLREVLKELAIAEPPGLPNTPQRAAGNPGVNRIRNGLLPQLLPPQQALPPGVQRLGLQVQPIPGGGLLVRAVEPDLRGEKMGIQPGDRVFKVQGEVVTSANDVLRIIAATVQPLVVEGTRNNEPFKLEEKAAEKDKQEKPAP